MLPTLLLTAALTQLQPLPPSLISLDSEEGQKLLLESKANRDYFALSSRFMTQRSTSYCGVASSVMVLNAMPIAAPEVKEWKPFRAFTEDNVFNEQARAATTPEAVSRGGLTMDQIAHLLSSNGVAAKPVFAGASSLEEFRREAAANAGRPDDYVLIDFWRGDLGQDVGAHWSPLAAYHEGTDRFLVLDVARFRYPPYWAKAEDLFKAMNTTDMDSGKSRGYVLVSAAAGAPPRMPVPSVGGRLLRVILMAGLGVFAAGAITGALLTRWRMRRKTA
ncbi:MAG TPA: phytochelatin synthase family protein [Myxococcales bacterium]|nr:phytochelatin synthase family protein [Myxococcales bacterium]